MDSCKADLAKTIINELSDLCQDLFFLEAYAHASHPGNNAKCAAEIAAILNLDQCSRTKRESRNSSLRTDASKKIWNQFLFLLVGIYSPDLRNVFEFLGGPLNITSCNNDPCIGPAAGNPPDKLAHIAVGPAGDRAGVHQDQVTKRWIFLVPQPLFLEFIRPQKSLCLVGTTAKGLDGERSHNSSLIFSDFFSTREAISFL